MDFLNLLLLAAPTGFWQNIILGLETVMKDYGLTLIVITVIIRFILLPFDLLNKYIMKNNARKQAKLKPQVEKLNKTYKNNPQLLNQKTMELYKRENFSVMGTCVGMLVNMVVTMIVFFTLLGALNGISYYKQLNQFETLATTYNVAVQEQTGNVAFDVETWTQEDINTLIATLTSEQQTAVNQAITTKYGEIKESFLWIKNIWKADTSTESILTYSEFSKIKGASDLAWVTEDTYNTIMSPVKEVYGGPNGLYLLIVLSALTTYLSMQISTWVSKRKAHKRGEEFKNPMGENKILTYIMPLVMAIFTLFYTAAFGIYIVTGSIFIMIAGPFMTLIAEHLDHKAQVKEQEKVTVSYSRKK